MKKAIMFIADGFEEIEAVTPIDIFRRAGLKCDICSVTGSLKLKGARSIELTADLMLGQSGFDPEEYDALLLPGGMPNAKTLAADQRLLGIIRKFDVQGKIIGAICAAPIALLAAGIISGKKVTSYPGVLESGNNYEYCEDNVMHDGNIITSRGPATAKDFAFAVLEALGHKKEAVSLKSSMLYTC